MSSKIRIGRRKQKLQDRPVAWSPLLLPYVSALTIYSAMRWVLPCLPFSSALVAARSVSEAFCGRNRRRYIGSRGTEGSARKAVSMPYVVVVL